jgi:hypothetical protein
MFSHPQERRVSIALVHQTADKSKVLRAARRSNAAVRMLPLFYSLRNSLPAARLTQREAEMPMSLAVGRKGYHEGADIWKEAMRSAEDMAKGSPIRGLRREAQGGTKALSCPRLGRSWTERCLRVSEAFASE